MSEDSIDYDYQDGNMRGETSSKVDSKVNTNVRRRSSINNHAKFLCKSIKTVVYNTIIEDMDEDMTTPMSKHKI